MSARERQTGGFEEPEFRPRWVGAALVEAAESVGDGDVSRDQLVAFEVALRVRDAPADHALPALSGLLAAVRADPNPGYGTLVNVLSAVQYVLVLDDDELGSWAPPRGALVRVLDRAAAENEPLREQAEDLVETLVERRLISPWLGRGAARMASRLDSSRLRAEVERQADHLHVARVSDGGDEYPIDAAAA